MAWIQKSADTFDSEIGPLWFNYGEYPLVWSSGRAWQAYVDINFYDYLLTGNAFAQADIDRTGWIYSRTTIYLLSSTEVSNLDGYYVTAWPGSNEFSISRLVNNGGTVIASKSYVLPETCTLRLEVENGIVRALVDGVEELSVADDTFSTSFYGAVSCSRQAPTGEWVHIDNWAVGQSDGVSTPPAPSGVTCTPGNGASTISFTPSPGATSNNLYWRTTSGVTKANGTKIAGVTSPYIHTGRTNGVPYYYVVTSEVP